MANEIKTKLIALMEKVSLAYLFEFITRADVRAFIDLFVPPIIHP